ncbi:MAG: hypothetical protein ABI723_03705 [Bacteroidia bacterium]
MKINDFISDQNNPNVVMTHISSTLTRVSIVKRVISGNKISCNVSGYFRNELTGVSSLRGTKQSVIGGDFREIASFLAMTIHIINL